MGLYSLTVDSARVRAGAWRGSSELAYLVPLTSASTLSPPVLERIRSRLRDDGFREVVTAAVGPSERDVFAADGFAEHEYLHLLHHDLRAPLPALPGRADALRRGKRSDRQAILDVDAVTFDDFWRLDEAGLGEAIGATPHSRLRVRCNDDGEVIGYAITGRAGSQGYLQRLAVDAAHQGSGIGTALVADSLHWLRRRQASVAWVNTQEANDAALALYTRIGFRAAAHHLTVLHRVL